MYIFLKIWRAKKTFPKVPEKNVTNRRKQMHLSPMYGVRQVNVNRTVFLSARQTVFVRHLF